MYNAHIVGGGSKSSIMMDMVMRKMKFMNRNANFATKFLFIPLQSVTTMKLRKPHARMGGPTIGNREKDIQKNILLGRNDVLVAEKKEI
jgi:hypothetical protein